MTDPLAGLVLVLGVEHLAERGGDQAALVAAAVIEHVADEVHGASLPRAAQHARDRCLEPLVVVRDRQTHALKPAFLQPAQELCPEGA